MLETKRKVAFLEQANQIDVPEQFLEQMQQYEEMIMMYRCAIREVQTKLEILNDALSVRFKRNPINFIKSRIKSHVSIMNKLERKGLEISLDSIEKNLNDVAGIRVVCHFVDDIYDVAHMLAIQDDLKILQIKDYIKNPKPNGYRSYHMIMFVPLDQGILAFVNPRHISVQSSCHQHFTAVVRDKNRFPLLIQQN